MNFYPNDCESQRTLPLHQVLLGFSRTQSLFCFFLMFMSVFEEMHVVCEVMKVMYWLKKAAVWGSERIWRCFRMELCASLHYSGKVRVRSIGSCVRVGVPCSSETNHER